jgi:hypothetical protein
MDDVISLSFRYSTDDVARATRSHYAARMRPRLDIVIAVLLAAAGAYLLRSPSSHSFGVFAVGASGAILVLLLAAFVIVPTLAFRLEPKYRDEYSLVFSQEGIHFRTVHIDSQLRWSLYSRVLVDAHSYLLYHGSRTFTVVPKRVFQSTEQRKAFEDLLGRRVSKIVTKN